MLFGGCFGAGAFIKKAEDIFVFRLFNVAVTFCKKRAFRPAPYAGSVPLAFWGR